jgi:multiple sugar transport system substrate-binding protein
VTITVSHAWEASFWPRQVAFDRAFMKRHPTIKIKAENTPWANYLTKYLTQAAGGTLPDLMYCQYAWIQNFIKLGTFIPLESYLAKTPNFNLADFTKPSLFAYKGPKDGKLYSIPYDTGPIILFYNKDIFDKAKMPYPGDGWTLQHMKDVAKAITHGSGPSKIFGFSGVPSPGAADLAPIGLMPFGALYLNEPHETKCLIDQPAAVAAMEWWFDFQRKGLVPSPAEANAMPGADPFLFGKVAMAYNGSWYTPNLNQNAKFKWDMAAWPRGPKAHVTSAEGSGYCITSSSSQKDAAWIYLNEYISTAGQIFMWASTGRGSPARNSAWPAYLSSKYAPQHAKVVQEALNAYSTPYVIYGPAGHKITTAAQSVWDLVVAGKMGVAQALKQITSTVTPLLGQNF